MRCVHCLQLLPLFADQGLHEQQHTRVAEHLNACATCRAEYARQQEDLRLLERPLTQAPAPPMFAAIMAKTAQAEHTRRITQCRWSLALATLCVGLLGGLRVARHFTTRPASPTRDVVTIKPIIPKAHAVAVTPIPDKPHVMKTVVIARQPRMSTAKRHHAMTALRVMARVDTAHPRQTPTAKKTLEPIIIVEEPRDKTTIAATATPLQPDMAASGLMNVIAEEQHTTGRYIAIPTPDGPGGTCRLTLYRIPDGKT
jgi:hypothetical protein